MENKLLFTNVKLYDGTGNAPFMADVAVEGDTIVDVKNCGEIVPDGYIVIDGGGLDMTPGFIDCHTHSDINCVNVPGGDSKIAQGVTTEVTGNCGVSYYIGKAKNSEKYKHIYGSFSAYADLVTQTRPAVNTAGLCGHNSLRTAVMGTENRPATDKEIEQMQALLAEALQQGAAGFSSGLYYIPGKFASTEEVARVASVLKGTGKPYTTHIRNEGNQLIESIEEAITIARAGDNILQISHLKTAGQENWHKLDKAFELIESARAEGMDVTVDRYPYVFSATTLRWVLPAPYDTVPTDELQSKLLNSADYAREMAAVFRERGKFDLNRILLVKTSVVEFQNFYGCSMVEIAEKLNISAEEIVVKLVALDNDVRAAYGTMSEENLDRILAKPYAILGSDGSIFAFDDNSTHPRAFGTAPGFFRIASKFADYAQVVRRMTALPAQKFNLAKRGLVAPGYMADLVLLNLDKYHCKADFRCPNQKAQGVKSVYVNGKLAYSDDPSAVTCRNGRMLLVK